MSADSAVTYTSVHSEARSWSIPSEDPYEEAAQQLLEQAPRSPEYNTDHMGSGGSTVPVYILQGPTMAHRVDHSHVDTMETRFRDIERRMMTALEMVNRRVSYQVDVRSRESSEFLSRTSLPEGSLQLRHEVTVLETEVHRHEWQRFATKMAPKKTTRLTRVPPVTPAPTTTTVTEAQLQALIDQGVAATMAKAEASRAMRVLSNFTRLFRKWSLCLALAIAQQLVKSNLRLALYKTMLLHGGMPMLRPLLLKMFPEEIDKIEKYISGLPDMIHGSVKASNPKTMQEAIEFTTELMDDKTQAYAERQAERKRKYDDLSKNNQNQQNKRQNTGQAYTAGNSDRKSYAGSKPLCSKCNCHLEAGPCST
ncbi:hypothetical protein Tco_0625497 [Tanacetum coccineum]|uniref:Reverse transcriptase domain-containing protein n=1 Tax=Tanacetum coccineum TaxID=301880 RepID=A0ABQ4WH29_9ASTR